MARPTKPDKKIAISVKLHPDILRWIDEQTENRAQIIERAVAVLATINAKNSNSRKRGNNDKV